MSENKVELYFGPDNFFGQSITYWMEIPKLT